MSQAGLAQHLIKCLQEKYVVKQFETNSLFSGPAIYFLALKKKHELRRLGYKAQDVFETHSLGVDLLIELIACWMLEVCFAPLKPQQQKNIDIQKSQFPDSLLKLTTTGSENEKEIYISAELLEFQLQKHHQILNIPPESIRLSILPYYHSFGLILDLLLGLYSQQVVVMAHSKSISKLHEIIKSENIQYFAAIPRHLNILTQQMNLENGQFLHFKELKIHYGGATLDSEIFKCLKEHGAEVFEGYGLTECAPGVLMNNTNIGLNIKWVPFESNTFVFELYVHKGCIGSWKNQILDSENFYPTQDLFTIISNQISFLGRRSDFLKNTNGEWVFKKDIELNLIQKLNLSQVFISFSRMQISGIGSTEPSKDEVDFEILNLKKKFGQSFDFKWFESNSMIQNIILSSDAKSIEASLQKTWAKL